MRAEFMTMFETLTTRAGDINAAHIVRISALCVRRTGNYHEIDFNHGTEARSTTATEDDVNEFREAQL